MWALNRGREDYAPSRIVYRVNRLWLSPLIRIGLVWVLPLTVTGGAVAFWAIQPGTQEMFQAWRLAIESRLRDQPDFQVRQMAVMGASPDLAREIRNTVGITFPVSVLDLPLDEIRTKVSAFDAVKSVDARVMLGGALVLTVTERTPAVVWRHDGGLELLDDQGKRVATTDSRDGAPDLPLIAASGAETEVPEALALFAAAQPIADRVRGLVRQGERRWDLELTGGRTIQLPETGAVEALERVIALHQAAKLLDRDVTVIDMRDPDRPTIRLGEDAFAYMRTVREYQQGLTKKK